jgi:hypothetical protein
MIWRHPAKKMLLSGYFPELVCARGGFGRNLPFEALRR